MYMWLRNMTRVSFISRRSALSLTSSFSFWVWEWNQPKHPIQIIPAQLPGAPGALYNGLPPLQPALLAPFCTTVSVMVYSVVGWRSAPLRYPVLALERALTRPAVPATPAVYECRGFESHLGQLFIFSLEKKSCRDRNRFSIDFLSHAACFTSNTVLPLLPLSLPISLFPLPLRLLSSCLFFVLLSSPLTSNFSQQVASILPSHTPPPCWCALILVSQGYLRQRKVIT